MKLNYRQYSEQGIPLLILHGLFGNLGNWGWHSKQLAEKFAVYAIDLRNHGNSPHDDELNYQVMAKDIRELMIELKLESCYIIGHSMGGKVAMQLALSYPELIKKMIVVDIAPVFYAEDADGHLNVLAGMDAINTEVIKSRTEAEETLKKYIVDEAIRKFILTNLARSKKGSYHWRLNKSAIRNNYPQLRAGLVSEDVFARPVLFVKGSLSNYIQAEHEAEIVKLFPAASVKIILQAGHWLHAEKPQALQRIVVDFFKA